MLYDRSVIQHVSSFLFVVIVQLQKKKYEVDALSAPIDSFADIKGLVPLQT